MGFAHNREYVDAYPSGFSPDSIITTSFLSPVLPVEGYRDMYFKYYFSVDTNRGLFYNNLLNGGNEWYNELVINAETYGCMFLTNITTEDVKRCAEDALDISYDDMWFCADWKG